MIAACSVLLAGIAGIAACRAIVRHHVAKMLNIGTLPASVSDIDCASFGSSDVLERCTFELAPADMETLLGGYRFDELAACPPGGIIGRPCLDPRKGTESSHSHCCGPKLGPDFPIAHTFIASPRAFEHGGTVTIVTDRDRRRAMVDLYIE